MDLKKIIQAATNRESSKINADAIRCRPTSNINRLEEEEEGEYRGGTREARINHLQQEMEEKQELIWKLKKIGKYSGRNKGDNGKERSPKCTYEKHMGSRTCPAEDKKCNTCDERGHFTGSKLCAGKRKKKSAMRVREEQSELDTSSESSDTEGEEKVNRVLRERMWPGSRAAASIRNARRIARVQIETEEETDSETDTDDESEDTDTEGEQDTDTKENSQDKEEWVWPGTRPNTRRRGRETRKTHNQTKTKNEYKRPVGQQENNEQEENSKQDQETKTTQQEGNYYLPAEPRPAEAHDYSTVVPSTGTDRSTGTEPTDANPSQSQHSCHEKESSTARDQDVKKYVTTKQDNVDRLRQLISKYTEGKKDYPNLKRMMDAGTYPTAQKKDLTAGHEGNNNRKGRRKHTTEGDASNTTTRNKLGRAGRRRNKGQGEKRRDVHKEKYDGHHTKDNGRNGQNEEHNSHNTEGNTGDLRDGNGRQETHYHVEEHNTKQLLAHKVILPATTHFKINGGDLLAGPRLAEAPDYDYSTVVHHTGADRSTARTTAQPTILYSQTKDANNADDDEANGYNNKGKSRTNGANNQAGRGNGEHTNEAGDGGTNGGRRRKRRQKQQRAGRN